MSIRTQAFVKAVTGARAGMKKTNFKQSFELILNVKGVDVSKPEKRFAEQVELPNGLGEKSRKICVIATGNIALEARRTKGVDRVLEKDEVESLVGNKKEAKRLASRYDHFLVEAQIMGSAARAIGAALGSRGKRPVPITPGQDIGDLVKKYVKTVTVQLRKTTQLSCIVGTENMRDEDVAGNAEAATRRVVEKLEKRLKNIGSVYIKATMGSPVKVAIAGGK